jgi:predicted transcriptional regulator
MSYHADDMRAGGMTYPEIAKTLGVSRQTVVRMFNPEYAERSRIKSRDLKRRRTGMCVNCGEPTKYNGHGRQVSERCTTCAPIAARTVDRDLIVGLRSQGLSQNEIAVRVGCTQAHVSGVLVAVGLGVGKGSRAALARETS